MREIALHVMDVVENGIAAGANLIQVFIDEARRENLLKVVIKDNGKGIPAEMLDNITDPFITTRTTRRVGLGLSLLETAARRCEGEFHIISPPGKGTETTATFLYDHIDRAPVGDMASSIALLIGGNPNIDFLYIHMIDGEDFTLDTRELREELSLSDPMVIFHLTQSIRDALSELEKKEQSF